MNKIIYFFQILVLMLFVSSCSIAKELKKKEQKKSWKLYVLFVNINNWERPSSKDILILKGSKSWIIWKIDQLDFLYDWKRGVCRTENMSVYFYPFHDTAPGSPA